MNQTDLFLEASLEEVSQYRFNLWIVRTKFSLPATKQIQRRKQTIGGFRLGCQNIISPIIIWTIDFITDLEQMILTEQEIFSVAQIEIDAFPATVIHLAD